MIGIKVEGYAKSSNVPFKGWIGSPLSFANSTRSSLNYNNRFTPLHLPITTKTTTFRPFSQSARIATESSIPNGSAKVASDAIRSATRPKPGFLLMIPTFVLTHFTLGWLMVPPIYFVFRQTNMGNALLAGPQGAWLLSRKIPAFIPDVVIDGLAGPVPAGRQGNEDGHQMTVEELVERMARRGLNSGWRYAKYGGQAIQGMRKLASGDQEELTKEAMRRIGGKNADKAKGDNEVEAQAKGIKDKIIGYTKRSARTAADEISFGQVRDGLAAYILVKILLPVRLPISLFLTPKVARFAMRSYQK